MLDREVAVRADRRLTNRLAAAKLRFPEACIEDIDFAGRRGLDRRHILQLAQGAWLQAKENLIITGQAGLCLRPPSRPARSFRTLFTGAASVRKSRHGAPRWPLPARRRQLARVQLLVLDDWGTHSLNDQQRLDLLEIFEERYRRKSTLITAQLHAILDRIVHNAHRINLEGDSMRKRKSTSHLTEAENKETNPA